MDVKRIIPVHLSSENIINFILGQTVILKDFLELPPEHCEQCLLCVTLMEIIVLHSLTAVIKEFLLSTGPYPVLTE